ncbi:MAG: ABC transporter substrate-binding protein [Candidatus Velthaea sp.]
MMSRVFAALCGTLSLSLLPCAAGAQPLDQVGVGFVNSVSDAPFLIADRKGYFREAGIKANFINFNSGALMVAPLGAGQLDVGGGAPSAGLYNAIGRGIAIKIVADRGTDAPGYGFSPLLVRKELVTSGKFKKIADLRGMKVAEPAKGSTIAPAIAKLLEQNGLTYNDVEHVFIGFPDQVSALRNGSIDATVTLEPWGTQAVRDGSAVRIAGNDTFYPNQQLAVVLYGNDFIQKRGDVARRFMVAYVRALRYYHDALKDGHLRGPTADDVVGILNQSLGVEPAILREMSPSSMSPDGRVNAVSLTADYDVYKKLGMITDDVSVERAIDMTFVDAAVKKLGPYKPRK